MYLLILIKWQKRHLFQICQNHLKSLRKRVCFWKNKKQLFVFLTSRQKQFLKMKLQCRQLQGWLIFTNVLCDFACFFWFGLSTNIIFPLASRSISIFFSLSTKNSYFHALIQIKNIVTALSKQEVSSAGIATAPKPDKITNATTSTGKRNNLRLIIPSKNESRTSSSSPSSTTNTKSPKTPQGEKSKHVFSLKKENTKLKVNIVRYKHGCGVMWHFRDSFVYFMNKNLCKLCVMVLHIFH